MAFKTYKDYGLYINGAWVKGQGEPIDVINPFDESVLGQAPTASPKQVQKAIDVSVAANKEWNALHAWQRADKMNQIADLLVKHGEDIAKAIVLETGKPKAQAMREVSLSYDQLVWFGEQGKRLKGEIVKSRFENTKSYIEYEPVGTVAAFCSWNFPLLLMVRKLAPAIAAGCPILIRSTDVAPLVAMKLLDCCHQAKLPKGLIALLIGKASSITPTIMQSNVVRKISLTGSIDVGKLLVEQSAQTLKKVTMELGGHAPVVVHADADPVEVAKLSCTVKFANAGQVCVSPTRFFVHESIVDEFSKTFAREAKKLKLGNGLDDDTQVGPLVHGKRLTEIESFMETVKDTGGEILTGGKRSKKFDKGYFFEPTVIRDLPNSSRLMCEEIFGPIALIQSFKDYDEVIEMANSTDYALASYTFTPNLRLAHKTSEDIIAGMVGVNCYTLAAAEVPFGGIGQSGFGRESGEQGMYEYLNSKITTIQI